MITQSTARLVALIGAALLAAAADPAQAQEKLAPPDWAYPVADKEQPPAPDENEVRQVPGSTVRYTRKEIDNLFKPPIWFPEQAVGMPRVVQSGTPPGVRACAACHLQSGQGHPESGHVSGLPKAYFLRQIQDYRDGNRTDKVWMTAMAKAMTDEDAAAAAEWFEKVKPTKWVRVVETDTIPRGYFNKSRKRLPLADGSTELLGERIAEFPADPVRVVDRDPNSGFVAYVPKGSVALGEKLVTDGLGKTIACAGCHGGDLKGKDDIPRIAGVSTLYTVRQLVAFRNGERTGSHADQMKPVTAELGLTDITAIAAYLASLEP